MAKRKQQSSLRYEPDNDPEPFYKNPPHKMQVVPQPKAAASPPKSLWEVAITAAPCGEFLLQVGATGECNAIAVALETAHRRPGVYHILDTGKPVRVGDQA